MRLNYLLALLIGLSSISCVSYWRGKEIAADIAALQGQAEQATEEQRAQRERLKSALEKIEKRLGKLTALVKKQADFSANSGNDIDILRNELAQIQGAIATWKHERSLPKKTPEKKPEAPAAESTAPKLPEKADDLYAYGWERRKAGDCTEANRAFFQLHKKYPRHYRADYALYWAARCQFETADYNASLHTLKTIYKRYKKGKKFDDALELMHDAYMGLRKCKFALMFIETLVDEHPKYKKMRRAKKKLARAKKLCGDK